MNDQQYKVKYQELKLKFASSLDTAWRLGYEQGLLGAQLQNAQQQVQQSQMQAQQAMQAAGAQGQGQPSQSGEQPSSEDAQQPQEASAPSENPEGSELDQHISELEGLLGKSDPSPDDLKKALQLLTLKKNEIKSIHIPTLNFAKKNHNLTYHADKALEMQKTVVESAMKIWADEEKRAVKDITKTLTSEGFVKE